MPDGAAESYAIDGDSYVSVRLLATKTGYFAGGGNDGWNGNVQSRIRSGRSSRYRGSSSKALADALQPASCSSISNNGYEGGTVSMSFMRLTGPTIRCARLCAVSTIRHRRDRLLVRGAPPLMWHTEPAPNGDVGLRRRHRTR